MHLAPAPRPWGRAPACRRSGPAAQAAAWLPRRPQAARLQARRQQHSRHARRWQRGAAVATSAWGGGGPAGAGDGSWQGGSERLRLLTKFVQEADPGLMQQFEGDAHPEVIIAMRQTITNMLGTLPPQFFRVVISTDAENLAQLMYSVLMSGYMFANAWTRLSLTQSMAELPAAAALLEPPPAPQPQELVGSGSAGNLAAAAAGCGGSYEGLGEAPAYAPGTQKVAVEGQVLRWHHENGKEVVPALAYIEQLERELAELRQQMEAAAAVAAAQARAATALQPLPGNELLDYLKRLSPEELVALTDCASEDVLEAMNLFVQRLMGMEEEAWQGGTSDCTAAELAQLMYWLMITGYSLRQIEQRCDLTRTLDLPGPDDPPPPPSLPPSRPR